MVIERAISDVPHVIGNVVDILRWTIDHVVVGGGRDGCTVCLFDGRFLVEVPDVVSESSGGHDENCRENERHVLFDERSDVFEIGDHENSFWWLWLMWGKIVCHNSMICWFTRIINEPWEGR